MKMKATWGLFIYTGKKDPDQIFAPILWETKSKVSTVYVFHKK